MADAPPPEAAHAALQLLHALASSQQMGGQSLDVGAAGALLQALAGGQVRARARRGARRRGARLRAWRHG